MDKTYFITDLDRTIIHSKNKGYRCVEIMGDREITYMTDDAYEKLKDLLDINSFCFVPCTMRNIKQTMRVDFIREYKPPIVICTNGAQIYINGELDIEWNEKMSQVSNIDELMSDIKYLEDLRKEYKDQINIVEIRNIENFYITIKCLNNIEADKFYDVINSRFSKNVNVIKIDRKIFIINEHINKLYAVDYIIDKFNITKLITAGDSDVDEEFTSRGRCILPGHCTFAKEGAIITNKKHIESTEEILAEVEKMLE